MTSLKSAVLPFSESQALEAAGIYLDTVFAYYPEGCGMYPFDDDGVTVPECQKYLGEPVPCLRDEMEDHAPLCGAPLLSELVNAVRDQIGVPLDRRIITLEEFGAREVTHYAESCDPHKNYHIAYHDSDLLATAALLVEIRKEHAT